MSSSNTYNFYRRWPVPDPKAVLLLVHGLGAHTGRWEAAAEFFAHRGFASYAVELRNFDSPGDGQGNFASYHDKVLRLHAIAVKENPSKRIFLVGESMGALISFLLASSHPGIFSGLVCISPAFDNRYVPALSKIALILAARILNPGKKIGLPFDSAMCTRDEAYRQKMNEDPREYRETSPGIILGLVLAQRRARSLNKKMGLSVLFLMAGNDMIVDNWAARTVFNRLAASDKTLVEFPGMYHALSIDMGKEAVFEEILSWIEKRI